MRQRAKVAAMAGERAAVTTKTGVRCAAAASARRRAGVKATVSRLPMTIAAAADETLSSMAQSVSAGVAVSTSNTRAGSRPRRTRPGP